MELKNFASEHSTEDLINALRTRDGVDGFEVEPHAPFMVVTNAKTDEPFTMRSNTGPVQILIITIPLACE